MKVSGIFISVAVVCGLSLSGSVEAGPVYPFGGDSGSSVTLSDAGYNRGRSPVPSTVYQETPTSTRQSSPFGRSRGMSAAEIILNYNWAMVDPEVRRQINVAADTQDVAGLRQLFAEVESARLMKSQHANHRMKGTDMMIKLFEDAGLFEMDYDAVKALVTQSAATEIPQKLTPDELEAASTLLHSFGLKEIRSISPRMLASFGQRMSEPVRADDLLKLAKAVLFRLHRHSPDYVNLLEGFTEEEIEEVTTIWEKSSPLDKAKAELDISIALHEATVHKDKKLDAIRSVAEDDGSLSGLWR